MCALLTCEKDNTDKIVEYVKESSQMGITVLPPDVNQSMLGFSVVDARTIRFGLLGVKNVGQTAIESIVNNRQAEGPYTTLYDLCERVDLRLANRKVLESLVKSGACDCFQAHRSQLMAAVEQALEAGAKAQKDRASGQFSFFTMDADPGGFQKGKEQLPDMKEWPQTEILSFEKEVLGFYMSGHPLAHYQTEIKEFADFTTRNLKQATDGQEIKLVGIINGIKLTTTRKSNERMAIVKIEDMDGDMEVVVFPSTYQTVAPYLVEGEVVVVVGRVSFRDEVPGLVARDIKKIDEVYKVVKAINVNLSGLAQNHLQELKKMLSLSPGQTPVYLFLDTRTRKGVQILVGQDLFVTPNENLMNEIKELVGEKRLTVSV
jgi:DNA polymerase-3 subunit alpha